MDESHTASIRTLISSVFADGEIELVELTCHPQGKVLMVRCLIDKVAGVTIQECARMNQRIGEALDAAGVIDESYTLEVSSPGLDRPLTTHRDYERAIGDDVRLYLRAELGGPRESKGQLLAVQPEAIVLKTSSGNVTIALNDIQTAKKVIKI